MRTKEAGSKAEERRAATLQAELVDIDWVAKRLGVTVRHVRRLVAERRIPLVKWGHLLRFDPREIDAWIDQARRPAATGRSTERRTPVVRSVRHKALAVDSAPLTPRIGGQTHALTTSIRIGASSSLGTVAGSLLGRGRGPVRGSRDFRN